MEIANRLAAFLAKVHFLLYIVFGIVMMQLLKMLNYYPSMNTIKYSFWVFVPIFFSMNWACNKFYADKYEEYTKNMGARGIAVPYSDSHFYKTITSDIGRTRKIAGYFYLLDKIVVFSFIGALFHLAAVVIANKP